MHSLLSDLNKYSKIFIGDYDSFSIIKNNLSMENIFFITKLALLLYDKILLPAAFFWQSETMSNLMIRMEEAISYGYILPVIRDYETTTDITDYFECRLQESKHINTLDVFEHPELMSEIASNSNKKTVMSLSNINTYVCSDIISAKESFKRNLVFDIKDSYDINSIRFLVMQTNVPLAEQKLILDFLLLETNNQYLSRAYFIDVIKKKIPKGNLQNQLCDRIFYVYQKSVAKLYNSSYFYSLDPLNNGIFEGNLYLFLRLIEIFGINKELVSSLSIHDILLIKGSSEYCNFIYEYKKIINSISGVHNNIELTLQKKLEDKLKQGASFKELVCKLNTLSSISGSIFIGLIVNYLSSSEINPYAFVASGLFGSFQFFLDKIKRSNLYIQTTSFYDFKNYILSYQYEHNILKYIKEK